jgi:hypothetical protein
MGAVENFKLPIGAEGIRDTATPSSFLKEGYGKSAIPEIKEAAFGVPKPFPQLVICPDGTIAGTATSSEDLARLKKECKK